MKTQWERLEYYVYQGNKEAVLKWLYDFDSDTRRQVEYMSDKDYLESESDEPWFHEVVKEMEDNTPSGIGELVWDDGMMEYLYTIFKEEDDEGI